MKRRALLQLAGASAAGLLLPSWLFPKPARRLVVPGFTAPRIRRVPAERLCPEVRGHTLAVRKMSHLPQPIEGADNFPLLRQRLEGDDTADAGFEGPPLVLDGPERAATAEETRDFINQWVRCREVPADYRKKWAQPISLEEARAVAEDGTLDDYLFATQGRPHPDDAAWAPWTRCHQPLEIVRLT
jgi:hypothetical protein